MTDSRVITRWVACDWRGAYALAADPRRLPDWASGLAGGEVLRDGADWTVQTPVSGPARLRWTPTNAFGVLDHWIGPPGKPEVYVPFRVIDLGAEGCEFQLTLLRQPGMDAAQFERDADWVKRDLAALARLLLDQAS